MTLALTPKDDAVEEIQGGLRRREPKFLCRVDAPALRAGRRIHPARRGHRGFLKREIAKPIIRWEDKDANNPRLRNPAEQILLPLPAAHARERLACGVLEAGEGGGENVGGLGDNEHERCHEREFAVADWLGEPWHWTCKALKRFVDPLVRRYASRMNARSYLRCRHYLGANQT